jgi:hypothetical protein
VSRSESGNGPLRRARGDLAGSVGVRLRTAEPLVRGRWMVSPESSKTSSRTGLSSIVQWSVLVMSTERELLVYWSIRRAEVNMRLLQLGPSPSCYSAATLVS